MRQATFARNKAEYYVKIIFKYNHLFLMHFKFVQKLISFDYGWRKGLVE